MAQRITIQTPVHASLERVWSSWITPEDVTHWNHASPDWHSPLGTNDFRVGGAFHYTMAAKDGSASFDFSGTYTAIFPKTHIASVMADGRTIDVTFEETSDGVLVTETFEAETENTEALQRAGWQAILENFREYVETKA